MKKLICIISVVFTLSLASIVYAQLGKTSGPRFYTEFKPIVGGWAEYQVTAEEGQPSKMKIAIVGKEGDAYWYETVIETKHEGRSVIKVLVSGDPEDPNNVKRVIVKTGNEPAMEIPTLMRQQPSEVNKQPAKVVDKGIETINVPAGTFTTKRFQYQEPDGVVDAWVHKDVPPYGVIKSQSKDFEMVLIGYGIGAKTLITEKPQKFEIPMMPQMR